MAEIKNTPLRTFHQEMGAKMVPRSGWNLPLNFSEGAADEHECCRSRAALFDLCADGRFRIAFPGASSKLSKLLFYGETPLEAGRCRRDLLADAQGTAVAPCLASCMGEEDFFLTVPFQCCAKALELFRAEGIEVTDLSEYLAAIGISGPESRNVLIQCGVNEEELPGKSETRLLELDGLRAIVSASDLYDEEGFEISFNAECADQIWDLFLETDLPWPAGLAAQDSLRIESGNIGATECLIPEKAALAVSNTARVIFEGRRAPFAGVKLFDGDKKERGRVTLGSFCPSLNCAAALVFFPEGKPEAGTVLYGDASGVEISGRIG